MILSQSLIIMLHRYVVIVRQNEERIKKSYGLVCLVRKRIYLRERNALGKLNDCKIRDHAEAVNLVHKIRF